MWCFGGGRERVVDWSGEREGLRELGIGSVLVSWFRFGSVVLVR